MREKILTTATEMFLNLGFKSVTMDDIANKMGISKKTIYTHFENKTKLVEAVTHHLFDTISDGIRKIQKEKENPILENYQIKRFAMCNLKDEETSPQYQLQKYYPKLFKEMRSKQFQFMQRVVIDNLERGITTGHYRRDIPLSFISRIHYAGMLAIKDKDLFPEEEYSNKRLMEYFLKYHLYAICTPKGLETLEELIESNDEINEI
ncbi:TetR/AcrR family transcriptional regulator [Salegentibacter chungangensis]|uniref:TetR/AcrR family transcriptional regulator n=1 Tax=Salegentibacter chungangensis TaxID=1335724 RepID=A0ABW3NMZ3_9FLAO